MKSVIHSGKSYAVIYDATLKDAPGIDFFNVDIWKAKKLLLGEALGRGSAWFLDTDFGEVVLRQFLRGGWVAKISRQSYFYTGIKRSRPFREFAILAALYEQGLPVPQPVAALCEHRACFSSGALITRRLLSAHTLADLLPDGATHLQPDGTTQAESETIPWFRVGSCIRQFHDAGVWHADLNARNIMLDSHSRVFLIDFDRARLSIGKAVDGAGNLKRLKRSLTKLWPTDSLASMQSSWTELEAGYHG